MNIHKSPYSAEEEEGGRRKEEGERRAPNKAGPMRPPLLNGIKWEQIVDIITIRFIQGSSSSYKVHAWRKEGRKEKDGPLIRLAL